VEGTELEVAAEVLGGGACAFFNSYTGFMQIITCIHHQDSLRPSTPLKTEPAKGTKAIGVDSIGRGYYYVIYYSNRFFLYVIYL
jgi:hypothetical protein